MKPMSPRDWGAVQRNQSASHRDRNTVRRKRGTPRRSKDNASVVTVGTGIALPGRIASLAVVAALLLLGTTIGCVSTEDNGPQLDRTIDHRWSRDIAVLYDELPQLHKNLFHQLPEAEYRRRIVSLHEDAAHLSAPEFETALRSIIADVGDAHTNISFPRTPVYPLQFHSFAEGIYVVAAVPGYEDYIGTRLESIDGRTVDEFRRAAAEITPYDNESQLKMMTPYYLTMPTLLVGLGVVDSPREVTVSLVEPDGTAITATLPSIERDSVTRLISIREQLAAAGTTIPVSRRDTDRFYRFEYLPERGAVYVQYNACRRDESYPMKRFVGELMSTVRDEEPSAIVVDLRRNSGGDSRVLQPFIDEITAWANADDGTDHELYVLIGRNTFSSAVLNAITLKQRGGAIFVGEPSGGRPNHYGEVKTIELPDLGRQVAYSTKYFDHYKAGDPPALMPDIPVEMSFFAYVEGIDPVLEAVWARVISVR